MACGLHGEPPSWMSEMATIEGPPVTMVTERSTRGLFEARFSVAHVTSAIVRVFQH